MTDTKTMTDRLRAALEEEILAGRLQPGDELDERKIAARFEVSRTPVRQALTQLASVGLVAMRPRQTSVVSALDIKQLAQMFEVLASLEAIACDLAARRMGDADLSALEALHEKIARTVEDGDPDAYAVLNLEFHQAIWAGAHNTYLEAQLSTLRLRLAPYRRWLIEKMDRLRRSHREHADILAALRDGDGAAASALMARHVQDGDRFIDFLMSEGART